MRASNQKDEHGAPGHQKFQNTGSGLLESRTEGTESERFM
jgi:hypothetical protein